MLVELGLTNHISLYGNTTATDLYVFASGIVHLPMFYRFLQAPGKHKYMPTGSEMFSLLINKVLLNVSVQIMESKL